MGITFEDLAEQDLCDLMCGKPEEDEELYECFHCGNKSVLWDSDFDFEDMGYEGIGIVHICHCTNCGAEIEYRISNNQEDNCI